MFPRAVPPKMFCLPRGSRLHMSDSETTAKQSPAASVPESPCALGAGCVGMSASVIILIVTVVAAVGCLYSLFAIWPSDSIIGAGATAKVPVVSHPVPVVMFGDRFSITVDEQLFVVVALAGALGGLVHALRSIVWYIGNRQLRWSWVAFYFLLPIVGAAGGTIFYILARGGLFSPSTSSSANLNPFGFAAIAVLVGLFSEQAVVKLRAVATTVFAEAEQGANHVDPRS